MRRLFSFLMSLKLLTAIALCLNLALGPFAAQAAAHQSPEVRQGLKLCDQLLTQVPEGFLGKIGKVGNDLTQVQRLELLLKAMSPQQRESLYKIMGEVDLNKVAAALASDDSNTGDAAILISDLIQFGEVYPGIFGLMNADQAVMGTLNLIRKTEVKKKLTHPDLLASMGRASRMRSAIDSTIANLIQQATVEYYGHTFGRKAWPNFKYNLRRFIFPTHKPVTQVIAWAQEVQKQLYRIREIDRVIVDLALSDADKNGMTDQEVEEVMEWVLNSPEELNEIEKLVKGVMGAGFGKGRAGEAGKFDIYRAAAKAEAFDFDDFYRRMDKVNMDSLDQMVKVLNAKAARQGGDKHEIEDYRPVELQMRFEAAQRAVDFTRADYRSWTAVRTTEFYKVEEKYYVTVIKTRMATRTDAKGKTETYMETYTEQEPRWRDQRVNPDFEMILSRDWERGDRSVWGLEPVAERTSSVAKKEAPARDLMDNVAHFLHVTSENYGQLFAKSTTEAMAKDAEALLADVRDMIKWQQSYMKSSTSAILSTYVNDNAENFRGRNAAMLRRLEAGQKALSYLAEIGRRPLPALYPPFEIYDFSDWLIELKRRRNLNYAAKVVAGITLPVAAFTAGVMAPEAVESAAQLARDLPMLLQKYSGL